MLNAEQFDYFSCMLDNARALAAAVVTGDAIDYCAAEQVSGQLSEFIEHLNGKTGSMDPDAVDPMAESVAQLINGSTPITPGKFWEILWMLKRCRDVLHMAGYYDMTAAADEMLNQYEVE